MIARGKKPLAVSRKQARFVPHPFSIFNFQFSILLDLPPFWRMVRQAWGLNAEVFAQIQQAPQGLWVALGVVMLAALSEELAQSIVLFINKVRPWRFAQTLLISAGSHVVGYLIWSISVWLVGVYLFGADVGLAAVAAAVGLGYAPQIFAFFTLIPFFGLWFSGVLTIWSLLAIIIAVQTGLGLEIWQAIVAAGLGWILLQLWRRTLGRPIDAIGRWMQRRTAGVPMKLTQADVPRLRLNSRFLADLRQNIETKQAAKRADTPPGKRKK